MVRPTFLPLRWSTFRHQAERSDAQGTHLTVPKPIAAYFPEAAACRREVICMKQRDYRAGR